MKQEELLKQVINELFSLDNLHQEYQDNDTHYVVDSQKEGNKLTITITLKENKDKKEFEDYISKMPDSLFEETWEKLSKEDDLHDLDEIYNSKDYKIVIDKFKKVSKQLAKDKIKYLQNFI